MTMKMLDRYPIFQEAYFVDDVRDAYAEQVRGLIDGGVHVNAISGISGAGRL